MCVIRLWPKLIDLDLERFCSSKENWVSLPEAEGWELGRQKSQMSIYRDVGCLRG